MKAENNLQKNLGIRIRHLRNQTGMSQERFALMIGVDRSYFASIESGKRNISIQTLSKIAAGLNLSLSELLDGIK